MAHTTIRSVLLVGAALALVTAFVACGSLNDVRVVVTDAPGGAGGSGDLSMSFAGRAGNAVSGAGTGGTHATGGTSNSADGGAAGELEAGTAGAVNLGGAGGVGGSSGFGGSGGVGGSGGTVGAAGHAGAAGASGTGGASGACNTVVQIGTLIVPTVGTGTIPALARSVIPVGTYVLTSEVWYGRGTPVATDNYRSTLAVTTVGAATSVIQVLEKTPTGETRYTMHINTTATPPNGVQVVCSTDPTALLNQDVQIDYSATGTTLQLAFGTTVLDSFTRQ